MGCSEKKIESGMPKSYILIDFIQGSMNLNVGFEKEKLQHGVIVHITVNVVARRIKKYAAL